MNRPLISILIVNYNGAAHLRACLNAINSQSLPRYQWEVIVLDNASPDGSAEIVAQEYSWCRLIRSKSNVGFAEGNNLAKQYARGEWLVLLNNDTFPDPHWLAELACEAKESQSNRIVSKLVLGTDGTKVNSGGVVLLRSGWAADQGFRADDEGQFEQSRNVFAGCGAALMIRNSPNDIFPADYFAYYEDVDSAWENMNVGSPFRYASRAVVMHALGSAAGEKSTLFTFLTERNRLLTTVRNADPFLATWATLKFALKAIIGATIQPHRHAVARLKALGSFLFRMPKTVQCRYDRRSQFIGSGR